MFFVALGRGQIERTNIWYFGDQVGLDFTSGTPTVLSDGALPMQMTMANETGGIDGNATYERLLYYEVELEN